MLERKPGRNWEQEGSEQLALVMKSSKVRTKETVLNLAKTSLLVNFLGIFSELFLVGIL